MLKTVKKCKIIKKRANNLKKFRNDTLYKFRTNRLQKNSTLLKTYYIWLNKNMLYIINSNGNIVITTKDKNYLGEILEITDNYIKIDFKPELIATKNPKIIVNELYINMNINNKKFGDEE
jgi:hypothetical protein